MSTPRRMTRRSASDIPSRGKSDPVHKNKVILVDDTTPTRPPKRARKAGATTPRRSNAHLSDIAFATGTQEALGDTKARRASECTDDEEDEEDALSSDDPLASFIDDDLGKSFIRRNAFDAYFAVTSKPSRTSSNVFSQLVRPLSLEEHNSLLRSFDAASGNKVELEKISKKQESLFHRYAFELAEGFNLLFFGFGSKRTLINKFARTICASRGHVVIVNAFQPNVGIRDILSRIEEVPGLTDSPLSQTSLEEQAGRIYDYFLPPAVRPDRPTAPRPLFLVIHNIDAPSLRSTHTKSILALLAMNPCIHLIASIDHIHAQMLWNTAEASGRKHLYGEEGTMDLPTTRSFAWAWHEVTTMQPYDVELAHVDFTRLPGKAAKTSASVAEMTETAAKHILASVNDKAKKLFALLAKTQLSLLDEGGQKLGPGCAVPYNALFNAARADFIATNDTSFKALLAEFRDHKLVISNIGSGGEMLGIPLHAEELRRLLGEL